MPGSDRRAHLNALKLTALVRDHLGDHPVPDPGEFSAGAALMHGSDAWVLLDEQPERGLGGALAWAVRHQALTLQVVAETATGTLARRARHMGFPVSVWHADGRTLSLAAAEPLPDQLPVPAAHLEFEPTMVMAGATPVVEHGVLAGEVFGLEVCRVVDDLHTGAVRLEVGVGAHDRDAFQLLHGDRPTAVALADVVQVVARHRLPGADPHPLNRLAAERALRALLVAEPHRIGATSVSLAAPPVPRPNLKDPVPCVAVASVDGLRTTVVCSTGVDLDAVPFCLDARESLGAGRCLLVVPARDAIPVQYSLAALATPPIELVPFPATRS